VVLGVRFADGFTEIAKNHVYMQVFSVATGMGECEHQNN
jgi:hypothetical protein